jgi:hypothetical protein
MDASSAILGRTVLDIFLDLKGLVKRADDTNGNEKKRDYSVVPLG